jgi:hypothetical protein
MRCILNYVLSCRSRIIRNIIYSILVYVSSYRSRIATNRGSLYSTTFPLLLHAISPPPTPRPAAPYLSISAAAPPLRHLLHYRRPAEPACSIDPERLPHRRAPPLSPTTGEIFPLTFSLPPCGPTRVRPHLCRSWRIWRIGRRPWRIWRIRGRPW